MKKSIQILFNKGQKHLEEPHKAISFTENKDADNLLNNIRDYPHAFVLGAIMDRRVSSQRAWIIPYKFSKEIDNFKFSTLYHLPQKKIIKIFNKNNLHIYNKKMAEYFYLAIRKIHEIYDSNAANIWIGKPSSGEVVRRFLNFDGVGRKIASMAANILLRDFKIPMSDKHCIDISADVQVKKVFVRLGLISEKASNDELIYLTRELNPEYPGIFDYYAWEVGKKWCKSPKPICNECCLEKFCEKVGVI